MRTWLIVVVSLTLTFGTIYVCAQQLLRQSANDPQIQLAEDTALQLSQNKGLAPILPERKIDITQSLAPYIIIFDNQGALVGTEATIHSKLPTFPPGVFEYTKTHGEDRFTWQPEADVRSAVVLVHYTNGYVAAGRSLREVEKRENQLFQVVAAGWLVSILSTTILSLGIEFYLSKKVTNTK